MTAFGASKLGEREWEEVESSGSAQFNEAEAHSTLPLPLSPWLRLIPQGPYAGASACREARPALMSAEPLSITTVSIARKVTLPTVQYSGHTNSTPLQKETKILDH